jgi:hypothetical protein
MKDIIPNARDITAEAIKYIEREGYWYASDQDEEDARSCWLALLFDAEGDYLTIGQGRTAAQAAAEAWVWTWHPCGDERWDWWDGVIPEIKSGYRFELFPPSTWEPDSPEWRNEAWSGNSGINALPRSWVERRREALQRGL